MAGAESRIDTPQTLDAFLDAISGLDRRLDARSGYIALIAFAARQPGSIDKVPPAWVEELKAMGFWFDGDMRDAAEFGARIRDVRFIDLPPEGTPVR